MVKTTISTPMTDDERPAHLVEAGEAIITLSRVMTRLRSECEWDRVQTVKSLRPYLLEEVHEVLDVLDRLGEDGSGDVDEHQSELGDLLLQIVFQSEIQREAGRFGFADVAHAIESKLIRRHPHIFSDGPRVPWEELKKEERRQKGNLEARPSALDGVPKHLPALLRAYRTGEKAHGVGFDWPNTDGVVAKIEEELDEVKATLTPLDRDRFEDEIGDLLYATVNLCRHLEVDPEAALRKTIARFEARFRHVETSMEDDGKSPHGASLDELDGYWEQAKKALKDDERR